VAAPPRESDGEERGLAIGIKETGVVIGPAIAAVLPMRNRSPLSRASSAVKTTTLLVALANVGCGGGASSDTGQVAQSTLARVTVPVVSTDDTATLASDNLGFAVDLYKALGTARSNLVFSPASISIALAMTYAGAGTTTATEMATTLHFTMPPDRLHPAFDALDLALTTPPAGSDPNAFALTIANTTWGQRGFSFLPTYLDLLAQDYGGGLRTVDFAAAPEPSRTAINAWVSEQTDRRISQLLPAGSIDSSTRLVLTDAVYFHGDWRKPFDPNSPMGTFHADGGDVAVAMMFNEKSVVPVWSGTGWRAAAVPYVGDTTSMVLIVPDQGTFAAFEAGLTASGLATIVSGQTGTGAVAMPRFKFSTATSLKKALMTMGMPSAFDSISADFSAIDGARDLSISDVVHQADIAVDEEGTTAAAAAAVTLQNTSAEVNTNTLVVDRPFLFFIRHNPTGAILFAGRVMDPTQ
jgi:serpin B